MKKSLPYLSCLTMMLATSAAIAQPAPSSVGSELSQVVSAATAKPTPGDQLVLQAINQLQHRASVSARLRHQVLIDAHQMYGAGNYWQTGSGDELKVRLELQIAGQDAKLLQVSNSRFLWLDRRLPTGRFVTRLDLSKLRADPALAGLPHHDIDPGEADWSALQPELMAHMGGLPSMLAALSENFSFLPPQAMRLALGPPFASQPTNVPVFAVVGHWKQDRLIAMLKSDKEKQKSGAKATPDHYLKLVQSLPDRLPQEMLLLVGQADLFPYRVEFRRLETPLPPAGGDSPIPYQLSVHPMAVFELSDVTFDAPVEAGQFDYAPGDADWLDTTAALLERLRQEHRAEVATRASDQSALPIR
jgi:hypothetical protein